MSAAVALLVLVTAQPEPRAEQPAPAARFRALDPARRSDIVRNLERRVLLDPDPVIQRIVSMARSFSGYPPVEPRTFHDPERWARGVAPARTLVEEGTPAHRAVRERIPLVPFLPDLHKAVFYDWRTGRVVRRAERLRAHEVFENFLAGYPPGSDAAVAHVLETLDRDPRQRPVAAYLGHLYADLDARVYEGVTLYEAWYSEQVVDVPDVDAIPFAVEILRTRAYRSPIPRGPRRERLYREIRDRAFAFRRYRTLREAAAAAFVSADPELDPTYAPLVPRFHYLYAVADERPARVAELLGDAGDRATFVRRMDHAVERSSAARALRERRRRRLREMAARLRNLALSLLR